MSINEPTLTLYRDYYKQRGIPDAAVEFMIAAQTRRLVLLRIVMDVLLILCTLLPVAAFVFYETAFVKQWLFAQAVWKESLFYDMRAMTRQDAWLFLHHIPLTLAFAVALKNLKYLLPFSETQKAQWVTTEVFCCNEQAMITLYKRGEKWDFRQFRKLVDSLRFSLNHFSIEASLCRIGKKWAYQGFVTGGIYLLIALMVAYYDFNSYQRLTENGLEVKSAFSDSPVHYAWKDVTEVEVECLGTPSYVINFSDKERYNILHSVPSSDKQKNLIALHEILQQEKVKITYRGSTPACEKNFEYFGLSNNPEIKKIFIENPKCDSMPTKQEQHP